MPKSQRRQNFGRQLEMRLHFVADARGAFFLHRRGTRNSHIHTRTKWIFHFAVEKLECGGNGQFFERGMPKMGCASRVGGTSKRVGARLAMIACIAGFCA